MPFISADASGPKHLELTLTRAKFDELTRDLVEATLSPTRQALSDAGMSVNDLDKVILVGGSTRIPAVVEAIRQLTGKDPSKGVNPDEVVALGAAIQAGVLTGDVTGVVLLDVTPLSLGIETLGGVMTRLIERNTTIPTSKKQVFSTAADNQTSVEIHVLQGEREFARDNKTLGRFTLTDLPPAPRGIPQIEVAFDLDANGIVNVSAKDLGTGKSQRITITSSGGLDKDEVERMVKEAELNAEADRLRREETELRNQADNLMYQTDKTIKDLGDKADATEVEHAQSAKTKLQEALNGTDTAAIQSAYDELNSAVQALAVKLYEQAAQADPTANPTSDGAEPVVDADYNVVDEEKK